MIDRAMVLTAGLGTRLRPLTDVRAKPAIPVGGEPMIRRIVRWLSSQGVIDLVLNLHHRPDTLTAAVGDGSDLAARVRYSWEGPQVLGTAGGPRQALTMVGADTFFVINGDTIAEMDLQRIADAHADSGALVTLGLVPNRDFHRYGGVQVNGRDRVTGFVGRGPSARGSWHFVGVQVAHASVFAPLPGGVRLDSIGGVYNELVQARPGSIQAFRCDVQFWDVGTPADYWHTSRAFSARSGSAEGVTVGCDAVIDPSARIRDSILWDAVEVGANACVEECIVTDGARVPAGVRYRRAIVTRRDGDPTAVTVSPLVK